jgi:hypothetical protein
MKIKQPRFFSFHKIILIILVNMYPELFARYHAEYQEIMETVFKKKIKEV